ncbi:uncharacterized protein LOC115879152 [Sitophilus oryzae]|uniref:Uncharacterized protein LOC115879152 n=1 Tax=Sitophilus oryzae TaxID=7048 RepID=A0A6J2XLD4_SITOR|nr:uncharacterized protein LOC115879152 [Sitophilus oryzae]
MSKVFEDYNFPANRIYNADETGITPVHIPGKNLAVKGQRQVGAITSGERGKLVTVLCPKNGITIVTLPPHTYHRLQPLDVCFFGPLKTAYNRECDSFPKSKNCQRIDQSDIAELFKKAYNKTATIEKDVKGFEATGIFPFNRGVINEEEFLITEETMTEGGEPQRQDNNKNKGDSVKKDVENKDKTANKLTKMIKDTVKGNISSKDLVEAGPSGISGQKTVNKMSNDFDTDSESDASVISYTDQDSDNDLEKSVRVTLSFEDIQPTSRFLRKGRKTHSQLFTVTPNKEELKKKEDAKVKKWNWRNQKEPNENY